MCVYGRVFTEDFNSLIILFVVTQLFIYIYQGCLSI